MSQPNAPVTAIRINDDGDQMILNRTCHLVELVLSVIESTSLSKAGCSQLIQILAVFVIFRCQASWKR